MVRVPSERFSFGLDGHSIATVDAAALQVAAAGRGLPTGKRHHPGILKEGTLASPTTDDGAVITDRPGGSRRETSGDPRTEAVQVFLEIRETGFRRPKPRFQADEVRRPPMRRRPEIDRRPGATCRPRDERMNNDPSPLTWAVPDEVARISITCPDSSVG